MLGKLAKAIDPKKIARNLVIAKLRTWSATICDALGEKRLRWMIENKQPLGKYMTQEAIAGLFGVEAKDIPQLQKEWGWSEQAVTDLDIYGAFPEWAQKLIIEEGELGTEWLRETIAWLRTQVRGS